MHDLFGRPLVALDDWKTAAKSGKGATHVALIKSYAGVIERAGGDDEKSPIRIRITSGTRDRERDSINPAGWQLDNFRKNPVVLFGHSYRDLPVGRDTGLTIDANGIV